MKVFVQPVTSEWDRGVSRTLDLSEEQADGRACLMCDEVGGPKVPIATSEGHSVQLFAHELCVHDAAIAYLGDLHQGAPARPAEPADPEARCHDPGCGHRIIEHGRNGCAADDEAAMGGCDCPRGFHRHLSSGAGV